MDKNLLLYGTHRDEILEAAKRDYQEASREKVRSGQRTQESLFFISPSIVKKMRFEHRTEEF